MIKACSEAKNVQGEIVTTIDIPETFVRPITLLFQLNDVHTARHKDKEMLITELQNMMKNLLLKDNRVDQDTVECSLKELLFNKYQQIRKSESEQSLALFRKSSRLGDFIERYLKHELGITTLPHKYSNELFDTIEKGFQDDQLKRLKKAMS